jgi:hypothetical protein
MENFILKKLLASNLFAFYFKRANPKPISSGDVFGSAAGGKVVLSLIHFRAPFLIVSKLSIGAEDQTKSTGGIVCAPVPIPFAWQIRLNGGYVNGESSCKHRTACLKNEQRVITRMIRSP